MSYSCTYTPPSIKVKPRPKTMKITLPGPDVHKAEMSQLACGRKFSFKITQPKINEWLSVEVTDGRGKINTVEIFDALSVEKTCTCDQYFEEESKYCVHIAALEGIEKLSWAPNDAAVQLFKMTLGREKIKIPINNRLYKQGAMFWDSHQECQKIFGKIPVCSENWAAYTRWNHARKQNSQTQQQLTNFSSVGLLKNNLNLFDYQEDIFNKLLNVKRGICAMTMGSGKAQPLDAKILTKNGWTTMGQLKIGSKIIGKNGKETTVTGVFPQGTKDVYKVYFTDGSSTECCEEHLWAVNTAEGKFKNKPEKILELGKIKDNLINRFGNHKYQIPIVESVKFQKQNVDIDPYFLGILIGDGHFGKTCVSLSTADAEIIRYVEKILPSSLKIRKSGKYDYHFSKIELDKNILLSKIRNLNLGGKRSWEKFIPPEYKYNTEKIRLSILQGLMDTDGFVSENGMSTIFYTTSNQLALDVQEIVRSLGGKAVLKTKQTFFKYKEILKKGRLSFAVYISMPSRLVPFRLKRKLNRFVPRTKYPPVKSFKKIELVGKKEVQCISVDAKDHLYVTDDYIVTHNTLTTIACCAQIKTAKPDAKILVIAPKSLCKQWISEIDRAIGLKSLWIDTEDRIKNVPTSSGPFVATYQYVTRHIDEFKKLKFDVVVVDEIQFVKNNDTKTWKAIKNLHSEYFFGLSGTVIENRLDDLFSIMEIIDPKCLGPKWKFNHQFQNVLIHTSSKVIYTGVKNLDLLKEKLEKNVFFFNKLNLPHITHTRIEAKMNADQKSFHEQNYQEAKLLIAKSLNQPLTFGEKAMLQAFLLKTRQSAQTAELITKQQPVLMPEKMKELEKLLKTICLSNNEKVVIFSEWVEHLKIAERTAKNIGISGVFFTGIETATQRNNNVQKFKTDPNSMIFFSSDAGGVGLDGLQLVANNVIHLELPWNPSRLDQRTGRVHRFLQTKPVNAYYLVSKESIEERIETLLDDKRETRNLTLEQFL